MARSRAPALALVTLSLLAGPSCVLFSVDAPCRSNLHCLEGERCELETGACVPTEADAGEPSADAGGPEPDAGLDAGPMDAGFDSGPVDGGDDGGPVDGGPDGGPVDAGLDGGFDAGPFPFEPSNVVVADLPASSAAVSLDCNGVASWQPDGGFVDWCGDEPSVVEGADVVVMTMASLSIAQGTTVRFGGDKPVVLVSYGDATVAGTIDVSAVGAVPGPGAAACAGGLGQPGAEASARGGGGGGGGGFGGAGARGGTGDNLGVAEGTGGVVEESVALVPLRGGCAGGEGGASVEFSTPNAAGGGGGGALQLTAAGTLVVSGDVRATGGGGQAGFPAGGGGGGGSGGAVLLEADEVEVSGRVSVNGGGGGGGGGDMDDEPAGAGDDGAADPATPAAGGVAGDPGQSGDGGEGSATGVAPTEGTRGDGNRGGGGGGGGAGRVHVRGQARCALVDAALGDEWSVSCPTCGDGDVDPLMGETCEPPDTASCNVDCTLSICGDGVPNVLDDELCDDGNNDTNDGCDDACRLEGDGFAVAPVNFVPTDYAPGPELSLTCGETIVFDTTTGDFEPWCDGERPFAREVTMTGGGQAWLVPVLGLTVGSSTVVELVGDRPVIFAVWGDVDVQGEIRADANGAVPGAGALAVDACGANAGGDGGVNPDDSRGVGGGGGGGFGTAGGVAGAGDEGNGAPGAAGLAAEDATLVPLRGGCPGGDGANSRDDPAWPGGLGGAGGGVFQISASGAVSVTGTLSAGGGGGGAPFEEAGGGGGGSGGGLLVEGQSLVDAGLYVVTGGGGAGGGNHNSDVATAGIDGALGGAGGTSGDRAGSGGAGGEPSPPTPGGAGVDGLDHTGGSGGGGGAGVVVRRELLE